MKIVNRKSNGAIKSTTINKVVTTKKVVIEPKETKEEIYKEENKVITDNQSAISKYSLCIIVQ